MESKNIINRFAEKMNIDANNVFGILKATAFKQRDGNEPSNEQMMALLLVAHQYGLNPFTKEIFAFPDKQAGIIPVVGVDGWSRIINHHDQFDGMEFIQADNYLSYPDAKACPEWIQCIIYRKDRSHPIKVIEYLDEVYRLPFESKNNGGYKILSAWQSHTKRMLRHKAMIQCARLAFGFVGIYDNDEAENIIAGGQTTTIIDIGAIDMNKISDRTKQLTKKLVDRAISTQAWESAMNYCQEQFSGVERRYVELTLIKARENNVVKLAHPDGNSTVIESNTSNSHEEIKEGQ
ncbi:phage recombination protein Bet [Thorsellia anophelis]|uniref:Phage recombination protein Bet n=1 Tax=Thorsellia anophelis DSM 18579 TaxID=1123402 RepID=A0A1I0CXA0_9GAMM|nr:phage recombination protein Bet [Thorsellia anophelis DSM 18579]